jgi:hypothetical protein
VQVAVALELEYELCPSCGNFVDELIDVTGFCKKCSYEAGHCIICGAKASDEEHSLCSRHRRELWLSTNADSIERYMALGFSFKTAKEKVRRDNGTKVNCLCCGGPAKSLFCTKTKKCRAARERMKYMIHRKGVPRELALKTVLGEL